MATHVVFTHGRGSDLNVRDRATTNNSRIVGSRRYGSLVFVNNVINEHTGSHSGNTWGNIGLNQFASITHGNGAELNMLRVRDIPGNRRMVVTENDVRMRQAPLNNASTPIIQGMFLNAGQVVTATHTVTVPHIEAFHSFTREWTRIAHGADGVWVASQFLRNA